MIGELPSEFLRVPSAEQVQAQLTSDGELARRLAQQEMGIYTRQQPHHQYAAQRTLYTDRLLISVVEVIEAAVKHTSGHLVARLIENSLFKVF